MLLQRSRFHGIKWQLPIISNAFTLEAFDLKEIHKAVLIFDEVAYKLANMSKLLYLEIVLTEKPVEISCHETGLLKS